MPNPSIRILSNCSESLGMNPDIPDCSGTKESKVKNPTSSNPKLDTPKPEKPDSTVTQEETPAKEA